jgi:hypothetical protein
MQLLHATTDEHIRIVRELFLEYAASLGLSLCFQGFDQERAALPGMYAPPDGRLLLALDENEIAGCVALRKLADERLPLARLPRDCAVLRKPGGGRAVHGAAVDGVRMKK